MTTFKLTILAIFFLLCSKGTAQNFSIYDEMVNAFLLGINEKGLNIGHEIISKRENSEHREDALLFLANKFFDEFISKGQDDEVSAKKAYSLYSVIIKDYPNTQFLEYIKFRIRFIEGIYAYLVIADNLYDQKLSRFSEALKRFEVSNYYFGSGNVDARSYVKLMLETDSKLSIAASYLDALILNNKEYEAFGYYQKIMLILSTYEYWPLSNSSIPNQLGIDENREIYPQFDSQFVNYKLIASEVYSYLKKLELSYPKSPLTMDAHIALAMKIWSDESYSKKARARLTKELLEYVVKNEEDLLSMRYFLARSFIIKNL